MYINRTLLLFLALAVLFLPSVEEWIIGGGTSWYRPYLVWAAIIALAWWNQRKSYGDDI